VSWFRGFLSDEDGATAVEYAVMLAMILVVCIVAIGQLGRQNSMLMDSNNSAIRNALTGS
jgi:pilus assembly protein Flp/PilA